MLFLLRTMNLEDPSFLLHQKLRFILLSSWYLFHLFCWVCSAVLSLWYSRRLGSNHIDRLSWTEIRSVGLLYIIEIQMKYESMYGWYLIPVWNTCNFFLFFFNAAKLHLLCFNCQTKTYLLPTVWGLQESLWENGVDSFPHCVPSCDHCCSFDQLHHPCGTGIISTLYTCEMWWAERWCSWFLLHGTTLTL